jgi:hypothetical protein
VRILRGSLKNDEFGLDRGQGLRLQHRYLRSAVVQDALQMIQQHTGQSNRFQPLPAQLVSK